MALFIVPLLFLLAWFYPMLPGHELPWCVIKIATGIDCPGCGLTRSISALLHGDIAGSLKFHPFGIIVAGFLGWRWIKKLIRGPFKL
ncbi:MAG: DUF2752 domain-containing protein [Deltaproteobacteria bacterium]|nr:DUF2752 domain-containing protein [Deltaproteobacteria bacterium]